jgi:hypothetical protein
VSAMLEADNNMIEVDGVLRHKLNSNNTLIHPTEEGIRNFWRWFNNSEVTDESGRPAVVYHGTKGNFDAFKTPSWFTDKEHFADMFSADWGDGERTEDSKVVQVYLKIAKPFKTSDWRVTENSAFKPDWVNERRSEGFDGVIFKEGDEIEFIAFDSVQIKAAAENNGDFNPASGNIYDAIKVDGVRRPKFNSNGAPIHPTDEGICNFWKWFGDAKTIDAFGRPIIAYHGTDHPEVRRFDGRESVGWFSTCQEQASQYAEEARSGVEENEDGLLSAPNVIPVYLSIKKPLQLPFDMNDRADVARQLLNSIDLDWDYFSGAETAWEVVNSHVFMSCLTQLSYDGIEIQERGITTLSPLHQAQIKSAIGNSGCFNPNSTEICDTGARMTQEESAAFIENEDTELLFGMA